ncbi:MAG: type 4a pilus biogenesis protein PilO [Candidatus Omnitrophota bacterium]|jgi:Tfp pilus assembly protein PilO
MKKLNLIVNIVVITVLVLVIALFGWYLKENFDLKASLAEKSAEYEKEENANRYLAELERKNEALKQEEQKINKVVPLNEEKPFGLVKDLIRVSTQAGLKECNFKITDSGTADTANNGLKQFFIKMKCESTFPQAINFLEKLSSMERLVLVETVAITRKKEILPYQEITFDMVSYTFVE